MIPFFKPRRSSEDKHRRYVEQLTLNQFFDDEYFPHAQSSKRLPHHDWSIYNKHVRASLGKYLMLELSNTMLDLWVREQVVAGYQRSTINKHIHLVNRIINLAKHWGYLPLVGTRLTAIKKLTLGDYKQRFLSEQEIEQLLKSCRASSHPYLSLVVQLLLLTGARVGEARLARWRDIDWDKRIWTVPRSKNGRSRRIVLSNSAVETLDAVKATAERLMLPATPNCYVFANPRTAKPYSSFDAAWIKARAACGLEDVRIHDLRHTFASILVNKGVSIYEVQTLLGHSNVQMTQRYAHLAPDRLHMRTEIVGDCVPIKTI